ncbi:MAG: hypothetical protein ABUS57_05280 [Pseudomonadota bacterium]
MSTTFLSEMSSEFRARRRRLRSAFGDRVQGLVEFLVFGGLVSGSAGLLLYPWMGPAAPWGFAIPPVFAAGYVLLERRRQTDVVRQRAYIAENQAALDETDLTRYRREVLEGRDPLFGADKLSAAEERFRQDAPQRHAERLANASAYVATRHDWGVFIWSMACAVAGGAAFVIAWQANPSKPEPEWQPPLNAPTVQIQP